MLDRSGYDDPLAAASWSCRFNLVHCLRSLLFSIKRCCALNTAPKMSGVVGVELDFCSVLWTVCGWLAVDARSSFKPVTECAIPYACPNREVLYCSPCKGQRWESNSSLAFLFLGHVSLQNQICSVNIVCMEPYGWSRCMMRAGFMLLRRPTTVCCRMSRSLERASKPGPGFQSV